MPHPIPDPDRPADRIDLRTPPLDLPPTRRADELRAAITATGLEIEGQTVVARTSGKDTVNVSELIRALDTNSLSPGLSYVPDVSIRAVPGNGTVSENLVCAVGKVPHIIELSPAQAELVRQLNLHTATVNAAADAFQAGNMLAYLSLVRLATKDHPDDPLLRDASKLFAGNPVAAQDPALTLEGKVYMFPVGQLYAHFGGTSGHQNSIEIFPQDVTWSRLPSNKEALDRIQQGETVAVRIASVTKGWATYAGLYIDGQNVLAMNPHAPNPRTYWFGLESEAPPGSDVRYLVCTSAGGTPPAAAPLMKQYSEALATARTGPPPPDRWRDARQERIFEVIRKVDAQIARTLSEALTDSQAKVSGGGTPPSSWHVVAKLLPLNASTVSGALGDALLSNFDLLCGIGCVSRLLACAESRRDELQAVVTPSVTDFTSLVALRNRLRPSVTLLEPGAWYGSATGGAGYVRPIQDEVKHFFKKATDTLALNCDPSDSASALLEVTKRLAWASPHPEEVRPIVETFAKIVGTGVATKEQLATLRAGLDGLSGLIRSESTHEVAARFDVVLKVLNTWYEIIEKDVRFFDGKPSFNGSYGYAFETALKGLYSLRFPQSEYSQDLYAAPSRPHFDYVTSISNWAMEAHLRSEQFRSLKVEPTWLSPEVQMLVREIRRDKAFHRIPELAPALKRAGCNDDFVQLHCSGPGPFVEADTVFQKFSKLVSDVRGAASNEKPAAGKSGWFFGWWTK